jgi:hypothetical protein
MGIACNAVAILSLCMKSLTTSLTTWKVNTSKVTQCFINGYLKQWLGFVFLAKVSVFSYENDFGDYEGVDKREAIRKIGDVKLLQQKHAVSRKGAKERAKYKRRFIVVRP